jgi:hypothetical protein
MPGVNQVAAYLGHPLSHLVTHTTVVLHELLTLTRHQNAALNRFFAVSRGNKDNDCFINPIPERSGTLPEKCTLPIYLVRCVLSDTCFELKSSRPELASRTSTQIRFAGTCVRLFPVLCLSE